MMALMSMFVASNKSNIAAGAGDRAADGIAEEGSTGVQEDALLAVTALLDVLSDGFLKYMEMFMPVLCSCLRNSNETQVCMNAIGLIGDLCRVLGRHMAPHCPEIVQIMGEILQARHISTLISLTI